MIIRTKSNDIYTLDNGVLFVGDNYSLNYVYLIMNNDYKIDVTGLNAVNKSVFSVLFPNYFQEEV